eukprot:gene6830-396_t
MASGNSIGDESSSPNDSAERDQIQHIQEELCGKEKELDCNVELKGSEQEEKSRDYMHNIKDTVQNEFLDQIRYFCSDNTFNEEQTQVVLNVSHAIWNATLSTPFNNLPEVIDLLHTHLLKSCVHRPPWTEAILTYADAKLVLNYFLETFFVHFKMYKLSCTRQADLKLDISYAEDTSMQFLRPTTQKNSSESEQTTTQLTST